MNPEKIEQYKSDSRRVIDNFDKIVFTTATIFLTLSVSVVSIKGPVPLEVDIILLKLSWLMFGLVIISHIISYLFTEFYLSRKINLLKKDERTDVDKDFLASISYLFSKWLDYFSIVLILIGIILFIIFGNSVI